MQASPAQYLTFVSHGARLGVHAGDAGVIDDVRGVLPPGSRLETLDRVDAAFSLSRVKGPAGRLDHRLCRGSERLGSSREFAGVLERLESELHFTVATHARTAVFVHAGVVGWRGRAIVLPGRSRSGKSSLVAALLRAGADYYSDEYAVLDADGFVHPYPKHLGIRGADGRSRKVAPGSFGGQVGSAPLRVGRIVATRYTPGARFEPHERGAGAAMMSLIANTVPVRERPDFALENLAPVARGARMFEGARGEADEAASALLRE